ncbi:flagellin N-terminal helical domain-containing protein [Aneurinibacillus danicus]|uniref:Flagellin n=1 Tax=Aneurinibacillus danicus TaxID=267746 RepID=A0A511V8B6_9BACL|nr:flagellin [Aneurinibacillus danicus]GEN35039.1 flagellin [Aneurinibacillus danicus]
MIINHNLNAMNAHRQFGINNFNTGKSIEKLSSGFRINRAGDDAAGLSISEKMRAQIKGLQQASRNSQDAISMIQTAEGALNETHSILQRMRELAVQSANDTNNTTDRKALQDEINQLTVEIDRIGKSTAFNEKKLLNGDTKTVNDSSGLAFQIGANNEESLRINLKIESMTASGLGIGGDASADVKQVTGASGTLVTPQNTTFANGSKTMYSVDITTASKARVAIDAFNNAIKTVSQERSKLGAYQNRLEHTISNLDNAAENLQAAESRVRDVDMAKEMMNYTKSNILSQASQAMLAQANQAPQSVLRLLG